MQSWIYKYLRRCYLEAQRSSISLQLAPHFENRVGILALRQTGDHQIFIYIFISRSMLMITFALHDLQVTNILHHVIGKRFGHLILHVRFESLKHQSNHICYHVEKFVKEPSYCYIVVPGNKIAPMIAID
jgi:hypothetical protein